MDSEKEFINNFVSEEKKPLNIIPKKSNIDLKRHISKKMDKLNKRTELSIVEILSNLYRASF